MCVTVLCFCPFWLVRHLPLSRRSSEVGQCSRLSPSSCSQVLVVRLNPQLLHQRRNGIHTCAVTSIAVVAGAQGLLLLSSSFPPYSSRLRGTSANLSSWLLSAAMESTGSVFEPRPSQDDYWKLAVHRGTLTTSRRACAICEIHCPAFLGEIQQNNTDQHFYPSFLP